MKKINKHYSLEFKLKAVELSNHRGTIDEVAKELNVSRESIRNWRRIFKEGKLNLINHPNTKVKSKEEEENIKLRKELYDMKMERDILKKAVSIFSKSDK